MTRIVVSFAKWWKAERYKDALRVAGGAALTLADADSTKPPPAAGWQALLDGAQGLLLTGGADVEPWRYGEPLHPDAGVEAVPERDAMEWELLAAARERRLPVFAICRGHQVVSAFLSGSLWQDLGEADAATKQLHDAGEERRRLVHLVETNGGGGSLAELLAAAGPLAVNSLHHQAVRLPGEGLRVVARSPDGVVEATEHEDPSWWLWTVQWHPEELVTAADHPLHRTLFERFLAAAAPLARRVGAAAR